MIAVFTITLLVSSFLLFLVQPMFAKMALPLLGGTPAVWSTCMVFFQATLLAGYLYAHLTTKWLGVRRQALLHVVLLLAPLLVLPIAIGEGWSPPVESNPIPWLLLLLTATLGLPFFVVAASAPLMQRWFSSLGHARSHDPYFLYAASNGGSIAALLAYPVIVEPLLNLPEQSRLWSGGYLVLILLTVACAAMVLRGARGEGLGLEGCGLTGRGTARLALSRQLRWIALTAVPSSLLLGVTTYITTDLVVAPLLWVIPLALYLLTFILVFARHRLIPQHIARRALPPAAIVLLIMLLVEATQPMLLIVAAHLIAFFVLALACHGELVDDRPEASHLTSFYLMMGIGGMLGGGFNALIAPHVFTTIAEYPIAIVAAALLMMRPAGSVILDGRAQTPGSTLLNLALPIAIGSGALIMLLIANAMQLQIGPARIALTVGLPALACYLVSVHPLRFGLALGAVFLAGSFDTINRGHVLDAYRSFYGVHRVTRSGEFHHLYHGTTLHGKQWIDVEAGQPVRPDEPLAYYHADGPIGPLFAVLRDHRFLDNVGLVGLGVGSLAAYGQPGERFTFFEIDPLVQKIAEDERRFTFISEARGRGVHIPVVLGDARLTLAQEEPGSFDLLVLDAFSSDAIPVHLLTREAIEMYWTKVAEGGFIALHISNRYMDLVPVLAAIADDLDLVCIVRNDTFVDDEVIERTGRWGSIWAVLARSADDLEPISEPLGRGGWGRPIVEPGAPVWTDDYSNILRALRW